ncbi:helix-turn-helix transcriptional regulator [Klebsiella michiganensis]|uniref:helix-turn-helix transcriptional regulator n=1 Tax=Klebsiella michiganensis TaxID=1134687 RepID=UPI002DBE4424|nr:helix-turn-helix transcriptional regulator [Klebsiella michiganensis]MEB8081407.1 helix-turn-helix transcriptional regulator [Klebsiella michiganensis]
MERREWGRGCEYFVISRDFIFSSAICFLLGKGKCDVVDSVSYFECVDFECTKLLIIQLEYGKCSFDLLVKTLKMCVTINNLPILLIDCTSGVFLLNSINKIINASVVSSKISFCQLESIIMEVASGNKVICNLSERKINKTDVPLLSFKEIVILLQVANGMSSKNISEKNNGNIKTIYAHIDNIKRKANVRRYSDLISICK